jgi:hypothetical protein
VDFTKGDILAKLFGAVAKRQVDKIIINPSKRIEQIQNLNIALSFAKHELQMRNLSLTAEGMTRILYALRDEYINRRKMKTESRKAKSFLAVMNSSFLIFFFLEVSLSLISPSYFFSQIHSVHGPIYSCINEGSMERASHVTQEVLFATRRSWRISSFGVG